MTREEFRNQVFQRDNYTCVFCPNKAADAHHILERRLWDDGGYYLNNGASVCPEHHLKCETTEISVEEVRAACKITDIVLPLHLYKDQIYDKWGNIILPNGSRLKGELFFDESVQKILKQGNVLDLFIDYIKYPRTYHLPWSEGMNEDDRMMQSISIFENQLVIVTEKMDGENTTLYNDNIHARSIDGRNHISQSWVKNFWNSIKADIPLGWRICGENLYAKHSIFYDNLPTYFFGFSVWNEKNICLDWDTTLEWFNLLGIQSVPILYDGIFDENKIKSLYDSKDWNNREGYVVRRRDEINYSEFKLKIGKFVRKNHVQTIEHWKYGKKLEKNLLKS